MGEDGKGWGWKMTTGWENGAYKRLRGGLERVNCVHYLRKIIAIWSFEMGIMMAAHGRPDHQTNIIRQVRTWWVPNRSVGLKIFSYFLIILYLEHS